MSPGNVEEFTRRGLGNPPIGRWSSNSPATPSRAAESGRPAVAEDYQLAEADEAILAVQARLPITWAAPRPPTPAESTVASTTRSPSPTCGASTSPAPTCPLPSGTDPMMAAARAHIDWLLRHISGAQPQTLTAATFSTSQACTTSTAGSAGNPAT